MDSMKCKDWGAIHTTCHINNYSNAMLFVRLVLK